ncbi:MAG TPA: hypothetical protein VFP66_03275, partial [Candidatus Limnocylindrales bacterium]|nr:hypothetical protein [Candidatus Limnocylindrales bacterium]
ERGLTVRRPGQTVATADHSIPTTPRDLPMLDLQAAAQIGRPVEDRLLGLAGVVGRGNGLDRLGLRIGTSSGRTWTRSVASLYAAGRWRVRAPSYRPP